ncbi:hypothetical protein HDU78_006165 [Chytriomyces hyalinus]|nr:hypothetical protein HDU78_006165 [Chytriomyces hyalinus]
MVRAPLRANKQILDVINLNMIQAGTANGLDLVAASAADGTLRNNTTHQAATPDNASVLYNHFTDTAQTFPGTLSKKFNASRLIRLNVKSSFASTLPRTNFAYDAIKHIHGLYLAHTADPAVINEKLQAWMNLQMTSDQSITAYWNEVSALLSDLFQTFSEPSTLVQKSSRTSASIHPQDFH